VDSHKGVEDEEPRPEGSDSGAEALAVDGGVKTQHRRCEQEEIESVKADTAMLADAGNALVSAGGRVLGQEEEGRSRL
jgi:hypothetical protein